MSPRSWLTTGRRRLLLIRFTCTAVRSRWMPRKLCLPTRRPSCDVLSGIRCSHQCLSMVDEAIWIPILSGLHPDETTGGTADSIWAEQQPSELPWEHNVSVAVRAAVPPPSFPDTHGACASPGMQVTYTAMELPGGSSDSPSSAPITSWRLHRLPLSAQLAPTRENSTKYAREPTAVIGRQPPSAHTCTRAP